MGRREKEKVSTIVFVCLFYFIVVQLQLSAFSPHSSTPPQPNPPPSPSFHPPPWFCPCVLYSSSGKPLSPLSLPPSPLAIVRLLLTSMSLVRFCLLFSSVDYVRVKGEIIWYFSLTVWFISLSVMLSGSLIFNISTRRFLIGSQEMI